MEIAFKFISKYLYFSPKKKHFHKDFVRTRHGNSEADHQGAHKGYGGSGYCFRRGSV